MRRLVVLSLMVSLLWLPAAPIAAAESTKSPPSTVAEPEAPKARHRPKSESKKDETPQKDKQPQEATAAKSTSTATSDKAPAKAVEKEPAKAAEKEPAKAAEKAPSKPAENATAKSAEKAPAKKSAEAPPSKQIVVQFTIKGEYPEGGRAPGMFAEMQPSLAMLVQRMDAAAGDKNVAAVWLKIEDTDIGRGKIHELRGAIARLRKANKPVYAELTSAETRHYLLASACDKIIMPPSGMLIIPGVRAEVTFVKGLLDKVGLQFDSLQMGKYKGAAEPLTRTEMSKPLRDSLEALVDDTYDDMVTTISADRKLKDYKVKTLLDQGLFTAAAAKQNGLIDDVLYSDQLQDAIKRELKIRHLDLQTTYKKKRIDTDFSGIGGMMKLLDLMMGGKPSETKGTKQKIAVVYASGSIVEGKGSGGILNEQVMGSTTIVSALRKAADDDKVAAIVLRIDSPGGSATASDLIWRETIRCGKPLIASMSDVAGSGGYYIAMGAKKIFAAPGTTTGSIGVVGGKLVTRGLYDKLGLHTEVISRGANSGSLSSNQPFTPEERKAWTELLQETYHQFVGKAAQGRKMPYSKLAELAQGRVYTGRMAKKLGLVDEIGTLDDAITAAKVAAGLKADADVDLMVLPEQKSIFEQLFGDPSATTDFESLLPEGMKLLRQSSVLRQLLSQRILLWMPYGVDVK